MPAMISRGGRPKIRAPRRLIGGNDAADFDEIWRGLSSSLREIRTKNASQLSFEQLYRNAYKLVLKKQGEALYNNVTHQERDWLVHSVRPEIASSILPGLSVDPAGAQAGSTANEFRVAAEALMRGLTAAWGDHCLCMSMTTDVLMYLDRVYCSENDRPCIMSMGMAQFRDQILRTPLPQPEGATILEALVEVMLGLIDLERHGEMIDVALIRSCSYMLEGLYDSENEEESSKLYLTVFEPAFLEASREYYRAESRRLLQGMDAGSFCRMAKNRLSEESDRCKSTLSTLTLSKIQSVVDLDLIRNSMPDVINNPGSGVHSMIDNERLEELALVYELSARTDPRKICLRESIQKRITVTGRDINAAIRQSAQGPSKPDPETVQKTDGENKPVPERSMNQQTVAAVKWVDDVLQLKAKYDRIHQNSLSGDKDLQAAITKSFTEFINDFERGSEYLSLFFDENLKKGIKGKSEAEVDILLDLGITLLRYVQDKDMFERYYKKHLSRRLLMKRTASMDAERQMISKMKMEVGNTFTQRIEAMFKDMAVSVDLTSSYKDHVKEFGDTDNKRAELDINVLTSTMWPLESMGSAYFENSDSAPIIYPSSIDRVKQGFEKFYLKKHNGRKLTWQSNMGTADIRAIFPKSKGNIKTRELNVSTYAMIILLLFNEVASDTSLTCAEIQARTNIPMHDLVRNLQSLAVAPKTRVLIKEPMSKDVNPTDKFSFNESFHSPLTKVKIGVVSNTNRVEDVDERKDTEKKNNDMRAGIIEAAIVRIMKQRKKLDHISLVTEVIQQLASRFKPDVTMVKKRIESLIEREYLERAENPDRAAYNYLA